VAQIYKVLGQSALGVTTLTDVYTVPVGKSAVVSTVLVANRSAVEVLVRLAVAVGGEADGLKQYLFYDLAFPANDSLAMTVGLTLAAGDVVRAYANLANISVNIFGSEIS
jgi:hypothetical protein